MSTPLPALADARARPRRGLAISERRALLASGDAVAVAAAFLIAFNVHTAQVRHVVFQVPRVALGLSVLTWLVATYMVNGYRLVDVVNLRSIFAGVVGTASLTVIALLAAFFVEPYRITRPTLLIFIPAAAVLVTVWRVAYRRAFATQIFAANLAIICDPAMWERIWADAGPVAARVYRVVDVVNPTRPDAVETIARIVAQRGADQVVVGQRDGMSRELFRVLVSSYDSGTPVRSLADLYEELTGRLLLDQLGHTWLMGLPMRSETSRLYAAFQRVIDLSVGLLGLMLLLPLLPVAAVAARLEGGGPVLFRQERLGKYGRPFQILKLRSMRLDEAPGERQTVAGDARVTRFGAFLRRLHLDELPQAWNIIKGDMSLIGPRPEQPEHVAMLTREIDFYPTRLSVRPGLTGWAQVNYGYGEGVEGARVKLSYDLYYIKRQSPALDVLILVRTLFAVLSFKGR